jgi:prepilin-type N-terminal cleavage/methylation domain-containing protein
MRKKGFTLIELLVVISIIAVLMSIMMPALAKVRENAKRTICLSNCRQWNIAASGYAAANDDYYPARIGNIADRDYDYSWPQQYYKVKSGGSVVYCDLISSFLKPYLSSPEAFFCPSVPKKAPRHSVNGQSILGMGWDGIIEEVNNAPADQAYLDGDYSLFTGYNMTNRKLLELTGGAVCFGECVPIPPRYKKDKILLEAPGLSPVKVSTSRSNVALSGDFLTYRQDKLFDGCHPSMVTKEDPEGMNASFVDGSSRWVSFPKLKPFMQYVSSGACFYWPDYEN